MDTKARQWRGRPDLEPFPAPRVPALAAEIVAEIALGRQYHLFIALRTDESMKTLHGYGAVERSSENAVMVGEGRYVVPLRIIRSYRLWVDVLRIDVVGVFGAEMQGEIDDTLPRSDVIELRERIDPFLLGLVMREGQCSTRSFVQVVLQSADHVQAVLQQRSADHEARCFVANSNHVITADPKIRERIVKFRVPFIAPALRLDGNDALRKASV